MVEYIDNFLEEHIAQLIDMQLREVSWKYDYDSVKGGANKHWHVFLGHIWNKIDEQFNNEMERAYLNAHTHGIEPHIHRDDGDETFIYYPRMDWKNEWGGGTVVYDNDVKNITHHINYKGNRLIRFSANLPHQAQPVSRECYQLRSCVVFKTKVK